MKELNQDLKLQGHEEKKGGKKPFNPFDQKVLAAQKMHQDHSINVLDICHALNISRATLYRYLKAKQGVTL